MKKLVYIALFPALAFASDNNKIPQTPPNTPQKGFFYSSALFNNFQNELQKKFTQQTTLQQAELERKKKLFASITENDEPLNEDNALTSEQAMSTLASFISKYSDPVTLHTAVIALINTLAAEKSNEEMSNNETPRKYRDEEINLEDLDLNQNFFPDAQRRLTFDNQTAHHNIFMDELEPEDESPSKKTRKDQTVFPSLNALSPVLQDEDDELLEKKEDTEDEPEEEASEEETATFSTFHARNTPNNEALFFLTKEHENNNSVDSYFADRS
ncbi:TPA: hypothetical protein DCW54_02725 [Candidatus Dependentiae bacterium]|nr:hypothetical protein [Candidatus Dependentiae bacterium]